MAPLPDSNHADMETLELRAQLARGELPLADPPDRIAPGETCHFVCPVRFGRRRADQFGHLVLSTGWLQFHGALDVSVAWSQIAGVRQDGSDIVVALNESARPLRFSCRTDGEASRGAIIAEHLAGLAHSDDEAVLKTQGPRPTAQRWSLGLES